jgi:hypothetical protein
MCGSGRIHTRCHGLRGSARRHRGRELHALAELHDLALLFPSVRPRGAAIESFADCLAASMGDEPRDSRAAEVAEEYVSCRAENGDGSSAPGPIVTPTAGTRSAGSLALSPRAIWSYEEALQAGSSPATGRHIARVRAQAERLRRRLPFDGLPRASETLLSGCDLVATDDVAAAGVAGLLLEAYGIMLEHRASYISQRN